MPAARDPHPAVLIPAITLLGTALLYGVFRLVEVLS